MDASTLQDRIARGMGVAARKVGCACILYRAKTLDSPVSDRNRIIKLFAAFESVGSAAAGSTRFQPMWKGVFDASYSEPGDYLVGPEDTYFVAAQTPAQPVWCVLTNRCVTIMRSTLSSQGGYSGLYASCSEKVIADWPAALVEEGANVRGGKVGSSSLASWTLLLPRLPSAPQVADVTTDDAGGTYVVEAAEQNSLGWRLLVRQIGA